MTQLSSRRSMITMGAAAALPAFLPQKVWGDNNANVKRRDIARDEVHVSPATGKYALSKLAYAVAQKRTGQLQSADLLEASASLHLLARDLAKSAADAELRKALQSFSPAQMEAQTIAAPQSLIDAVRAWLPTLKDSDLQMTTSFFSTDASNSMAKQLDAEGISGLVHKFADVLRLMAVFGSNSTANGIGLSPTTFDQSSRGRLEFPTYQAGRPRLRRVCIAKHWSPKDCQALQDALDSAFWLGVFLSILCIGATVATGGAVGVICAVFWADGGVGAGIAQGLYWLLLHEHCS